MIDKSTQFRRQAVAFFVIFMHFNLDTQMNIDILKIEFPIKCIFYINN